MSDILIIETPPKGMEAYFTWKKHFFLNWIYIDKDFRHQNIASFFLDYIFKIAKKAKASHIELDYYMDNKAANALYDKMGFTNIFIKKRKTLYPPPHKDLKNLLDLITKVCIIRDPFPCWK